MIKFSSFIKSNNFDLFIFLPIVFLIIIGIFGIFSISMRIDEKYDLLIKKHIVFCLLGLVIIIVCSKLSIKNLIIFSIIFFIYSILLSISTIFFFLKQKVQVGG